MTGEFITDRHLGGFVRGGDPDTQYPNLWQWLVSDAGMRSVLDVGCGDGAALETFSRLGATVAGVDGMAHDDPRITTHDYTTGPRGGEETYDMVWSCEFVEHVEEQYIPNFMADFCRGELIAMTHGLPGQPGWHHVNCQPAEYWQAVMASYGYAFDTSLTNEARVKARFHGNPDNYFVRTGMIFLRQP